MNLHERLSAFITLGQSLQAMNAADRATLALNARQENGWFTETSVSLAFEGLRVLLAPEALRGWVEQYDFNNTQTRTIGVAMAGNIPLVGFHDFLCVLMAGHNLRYKPSSKDTVLMDFIEKTLVSIEPRFASRISRGERLNGVDAIIATGSDNTSRYVEYYFRHIPRILRKNRVSCAVIQGDEPAEEITRLGHDIFGYYGLGCRNVSSLLVPRDYDVQELMQGLSGFSTVLENPKYENNYTYQKTLLLLNQEKFIDNGFLLLLESDKLISPVAVLHLSVYQDLADLRTKVDSMKEKLQVVVSARSWFEGSIPFGTAQYPKVTDYADGVDTMKFLGALK